MNYIFVIIFFVNIFEFVFSSYGDGSLYFKRCSGFCTNRFCINGRSNRYKSKIRFPDEMIYGQYSVKKYEYAIRWRCDDECQYVCMWKTVRMFELDYTEVPQFYGKWPMIRLWGVQEFASAAASLANFLSTLIMFLYFLKHVASTCPTFRLWCLYSYSALIAWTSAFIFHSRDTWLTERLDYFSALFTVVCGSYICVYRLMLINHPRSQILFGMMCGLYLLAHISYMTLHKFDYQLNLMALGTIGAINIGMWLWWSIQHWRELPQTRFITIWGLVIASFSVLEFGVDFEPWAWMVDSHCLWHVATILTPIPLYRFAILDCSYLKSKYGEHND